MHEAIRVFVGTYTSPIAPDLDPVPGTQATGVYVFSFDSDTGDLRQTSAPAPSTNSSFLALDRSARYLYAVNEVASLRGEPGGTVSAFSVSPASGELTRAGTVSSGGVGPCHIALAADESSLIVSNFLDGSLSRIPLPGAGRLSEPAQIIRHEGSSVHPTMQTRAHAHMAITDPLTGIVYVPDLGADRIFAYTWSADASLVAEESLSIRAAAGAGPRHMDFGKDARCAYVINQLDSTISVLARDDEDGRKLAERQIVSTLPQGYTGSNDAAAIQVHPSGRFVYASNRGHDSVVIYAVDPETGALEWLGHVPCGGKTPRHMAFDPEGRNLLVANHDSDTIAVFRVDSRTGSLEEIRRCSTPAPACIVASDYRSRSE
ncbi:MAG: lactonase family protein [Spirochaetales bacterium]